MLSLSQRIATELGVLEQQVSNTIELIDDGSTVPFIARYRKEVTGGLDDNQLRQLAERLVYLRELDERRASIVKSIDEQGKLTPQLKQALFAADTKSALEDLYLPYKKKRRTKAQIAREAGLEPLALALLQDATLEPDTAAAAYHNTEHGITDNASALEGARQILMEVFAEDAVLLGQMREHLWSQGLLISKVIPGKEADGAKFSDYFDFSEALVKVPSHRALAMFRGRNEGILNLYLQIPDADNLPRHPCEAMIARHFNISDQGRAADSWLLQTVRGAWRIRINGSLEVELKTRIKDAASGEAINVFAHNLRDLLLAAPAGTRATLGLDPGLRTGVKVAVVSDTGKVLDTATIYPHAPKNRWDVAMDILAALCIKHQVDLIAIGNGTASRETDRLVTQMLQKHSQLKAQKVVVSEAGASVYSASELASKELPELDVSLRGAVSIARRLQDPLAELVKIDPKSIGVGQYQHDVSQTQLARKLEAVVEDCVNAVGVDVNSASPQLLSRVAGLSPALAENMVQYRNEHGAFKDRGQILKVPRMGAKAFEQAGGFLRVVNGSNPLDNSGVHPESYPVVQRIIDATGKDIRDLIGDEKFLRSLDPARFTDETFGIPTVTDILSELEKPGRDPRPEFKTAGFREGIEELSDLEAGMILEGAVTNVTNFGAFVDIGVHQDGLVHISMLADKFVKDPHSVVKTGDVVKVKVLEVDLQRRRVALTMRLSDDASNRRQDAAPRSPTPKPKGHREKAIKETLNNSAMADALQALKR